MRSKLTPELQEKICEYIAKGHYIERACALCGIGRRTFYTWLEKAERGGKYAEFFEAVKRAEAQDQDRALEAINTVAYEDRKWPAIFRKLESRYPREWAKHEVIHHSDEQEGQRILSKLLEELRKPKQIEEKAAVEGEYIEVEQEREQA